MIIQILLLPLLINFSRPIFPAVGGEIWKKSNILKMRKWMKRIRACTKKSINKWFECFLFSWCVCVVCVQNDKAKKKSFFLIFLIFLIAQIFILSSVTMSSTHVIWFRCDTCHVQWVFIVTTPKLEYSLCALYKYRVAPEQNGERERTSSLWFIWIAFSKWKGRRAKTLIKLCTWVYERTSNGTKKKEEKKFTSWEKSDYVTLRRRKREREKMKRRAGTQSRCEAMETATALFRGWWNFPTSTF